MSSTTEGVYVYKLTDAPDMERIFEYQKKKKLNKNILHQLFPSHSPPSSLIWLSIKNLEQKTHKTTAEYVEIT